MFRLHIYNFWSSLPHFEFVPGCFINLTCSCYPSGTVWVLNCKSLWVKGINRINFWSAETANSLWLSLKGRILPSLWVWDWHHPSTQCDTHCTKPRAPQGGIITLQLLSKSQALPYFHISPEEIIFLLFWILGEKQHHLCSVGGWEWAPGFLRHLFSLLLRREINTRRVAHTLVYSRGAQQRSCAERSHALQLFWITVSSTPPTLMQWVCKAQPCSVNSTGICCRVMCPPGFGGRSQSQVHRTWSCPQTVLPACRHSNMVNIHKIKFLSSQEKGGCGLALRISTLLNHLWILLHGQHKISSTVTALSAWVSWYGSWKKILSSKGEQFL